MRQYNYYMLNILIWIYVEYSVSTQWTTDFWKTSDNYWMSHRRRYRTNYRSLMQKNKNDIGERKGEHTEDKECWSHYQRVSVIYISCVHWFVSFASATPITADRSTASQLSGIYLQIVPTFYQVCHK